MRIITLLLCILAASCAPKAIVVGPIAPKATVVREAAARATRSAVTVKKATAAVHQEAVVIVKEAVTLKSETERLSHQSAISPAEWDAFITLQDTHYQSVFAHEITSRQTDNRAAEHVEEQIVVEKEATELVPHAVATDKNTVAIVAKTEALQDNAAIGKGVKWIVGLLIGALLLIYVVMPLVTAALSRLKPPL